MSQKIYKCLICRKRCENAGALKIHMKSHKRPEPKIQFIAKICEARNFEIDEDRITGHWIEANQNGATIKVAWESTSNCRFKSGASTTSSPTATIAAEYKWIQCSCSPYWTCRYWPGKKAPHFRAAHVRHYKKLKSQYPMIDKKKCTIKQMRAHSSLPELV